jgi:hypothetical protein
MNGKVSNTLNIHINWTTTIFILAFILLLTACNEPPGSSLAKVNQVEVVTNPGNPSRYYAVASGILPDGCTQLGRASQRVVATTIKVTLPTQPAEGTCSQLATASFEENIPLRVNGLAAGSYAVDVNGTVASFVLTENH